VRTNAPDRPVNRTYENPLAPDAGNKGTVDSCADPAVVRGPSRWFMYCTSDPLNDEDVDAEGNLILRPIPMLVSRNLIDWRYVGDALPEPPSWAADGAGCGPRTWSTRWPPSATTSRSR
jgi:arabinan endo-1,5-alpha-L-arabinosidase